MARRMPQRSTQVCTKVSQPVGAKTPMNVSTSFGVSGGGAGIFPRKNMEENRMKRSPSRAPAMLDAIFIGAVFCESYLFASSASRRSKFCSLAVPFTASHFSAASESVRDQEFVLFGLGAHEISFYRRTDRLFKDTTSECGDSGHHSLILFV